MLIHFHISCGHVCRVESKPHASLSLKYLLSDLLQKGKICPSHRIKSTASWLLPYYPTITQIFLQLFSCALCLEWFPLGYTHLNQWLMVEVSTVTQPLRLKLPWILPERLPFHPTDSSLLPLRLDFIFPDSSHNLWVQSYQCSCLLTLYP